jgi:histidinol-phosphate aminotransferase
LTAFADLIQRIGRPESIGHVAYNVPQDAGFARMHQNEAYLPEDVVPLAGLWQDCAEVLGAMWRQQGRGANSYPSLDPRKLRAAYARYLGVAIDHVEVFSGSSDALQTIAAGCFRPGARIAFFDPSFSILQDMVRFWGAVHVPIRLGHDYQVDPESLLSDEVLQADVIILCTPNNPTGVTVDPVLIEKVAQRCRGLLVIDEAYFEFARVRNPSHREFLDLAVSSPHVLVTRTLSKAWGAAGLRIGALVGASEAVSFFARLRHPYSVSSPAEVIGAHILETKQHVMVEICKRAVEDCDLIATELFKIAADSTVEGSLKVFPSQGNFVFCSTPAAAAVAQLCYDSGIIVRRLQFPLRDPKGGAAVPTDHLRVSPWDRPSLFKFLSIMRGAHLSGHP